MRITPTTIKAGIAALALSVTAACVVTSATADAAPAKTTQKIAFWIVGSDDTHVTVVIHGGITDAGKETNTNDSYDVSKLSKGTIRVNHPESKEKFTSSLDKKTCYASFTSTGTGTLDHGTGAYKGYTGKVSFKGSGHFILKRNAKGVCDLNSNGVGVYSISGTGTVTH